MRIIIIFIIIRSCFDSRSAQVTATPELNLSAMQRFFPLLLRAVPAELNCLLLPLAVRVELKNLLLHVSVLNRLQLLLAL